MNPIATLQKHGLYYLFFSLTDKIHSIISIFPFYKLLAKRYYESKKYGVHSYNVQIDPLTRRHINPNKITNISNHPDHKYLTKKRMDLIGTVSDGDWDKNTPEFDDEMIIFESFRQRFKEDIKWKQTPYVREAIMAVQQGEKKWHNCRNISDIEERCSYLDELYHEIKNNGYKSQFELNNSGSYPHKLTNEILVDVSRNGEPLFVDGKHRLSIAKILDLDTVPVTVIVRHKSHMLNLEQQYYTTNSEQHWDVQ